MDGSWTTNWTSPLFTQIKRKEKLLDTPIIHSTNRNDMSILYIHHSHNLAKGMKKQPSKDFCIRV